MGDDLRRTGWRSAASVVLTVLGGVLLLGGAVMLWGQHTLFRPDGFSQAAVRAVEDPAVKDAITAQLVDQIIARGSPDLITVRPLLETVVRTVISNPAFLRLYTRAVEELHRSVFDANQDSLALSVADISVVVLSALRTVAPDVAAKFPQDLESGLIHFSEGDFAVDVAQAAEDVDILAVVLPALAVLCFAGALWVSPRRRRAVLGICIAGAAVALVALLALSIGRELLVGSLTTPLGHEALDGVWNAFVAPLRWWMWALGIGSVLAAAAITSTDYAGEARGSLERARRFVTRPPASPLGRLGYAAVLMVAGLFVLTRQEAAIEIVVSGAGLLALYLGLTELVRLVAPPTRRQPASAGTVAAGSGGSLTRTRWVAGGAVAGVLVLLLGVVWLNRDSAGIDVAEAAEVVRCNGHEELCDRRLNEVTFAATHNSMSAADEKGWFFASHDRNIREQLDDGIRGLLIDTHYGLPVRGGVRTDLNASLNRVRADEQLGPEGIAAARRISDRWSGAGNANRRVYLCHGLCELGATDLVGSLSDIHDFLEQNPHEVLILFFEDYVKPDDMEAAFEASSLIDYVYTHPAGAQWPTLRELIDQDRRVLVLSENAGSLARPAWYHAGFDLAQETPYAFTAPGAFNCKPNRGKADSALFQINHWIEKLTPTQADAAIVNAAEFLRERALQCKQERGLHPTILAVNFYRTGDVLRVADALNGVGEDSDGSR